MNETLKTGQHYSSHSISQAREVPFYRNAKNLKNQSFKHESPRVSLDRPARPRGQVDKRYCHHHTHPLTYSMGWGRGGVSTERGDSQVRTPSRIQTVSRTLPFDIPVRVPYPSIYQSGFPNKFLSLDAMNNPRKNISAYPAIQYNYLCTYDYLTCMLGSALPCICV